MQFYGANILQHDALTLTSRQLLAALCVSLDFQAARGAVTRVNGHQHPPSFSTR